MGRGRSVVEVPDDWGTNKTKCGTPIADTVTFHSEFVELCRIMPIDNFSQVEIASYRKLPPAWTTVPDLLLGHSGGTPGVDAVPVEPEWNKRLERFGLELQIAVLDVEKPTGSPDTADPAAGTPVPRGSTVTITTGH